MFSEEEPELRELIIQNLENCGFLNKIKAELRAGVFLALEEDGNLRKKIPLFNEKFDDFAGTSEGKLILSLVREFLEYFSLNFTLSVFDPEVASTAPCISRSELCEQLNLQTSEINGPIISALLKDVTGDRKQSSAGKMSNELKTVPEKLITVLSETATEKTDLDNTFTLENVDLSKKKSLMQNNSEIRSLRSSKDDTKQTFNNTSTFLEADVSENARNKTLTDILMGKSNETKSGNQDDMFKESKDMSSSDHDPFFDEPVPSEKSSFFNFSDTLKDKPESKLASNIKRDLDDPKRSTLSSLRDLPSLTASHEWTFSRDPASNLPSLDSLKSSSTETFNEKTADLDSRENFEKKDSDIAESNEDSSEKQISEESIEEQLDDDFSAGMEDLLNSSLSLGDDVTTDQTISQVSVVEGVDHIEACNS